MIYVIPDSKLSKLEKQCNRIRNKGANVTFEVGNPVMIQAVNNEDVSTPGHEVKVEGFYKIDDWEFVATIDHTPAGNIIRCINSSLESKIPEKYKTCGPECEHCHRIRNRKDTYLIYNSKTDEFKQVGKSCLREYTKGLDAELCADIASFFAVCEDADYYEDDFVFTGQGRYVSARQFKKHAYGVVKEFGYQKEGVTVDKILASMIGRLDHEVKLATDEELQAITEYADSITDEYGYMRNAKLTWAKEYLEYRDFALIASFINTYFKHLNQLTQQKVNSETTSWVGEVGQKITVEIDSYRMLFSSSTQVAYNTYSYSFTYEIIDKEGHIFIWKASHRIDMLRDEDGDYTMEHIKPTKIKGTIKEHTEFRGKKQTVLTRCKVIEYENLKEELEGVQSARNAMNKLLDDFDE